MIKEHKRNFLVSFLYKVFLRKEWSRHVNNWHFVGDCIFCYVSTSDQVKFWSQTTPDKEREK